MSALELSLGVVTTTVAADGARRLDVIIVNFLTDAERFVVVVALCRVAILKR